MFPVSDKHSSRFWTFWEICHLDLNLSGTNNHWVRPQLSHWLLRLSSWFLNQCLHFILKSECFKKKVELCFSYLLLGLEHIAAEDITLSISRDVAENLQILGVMRHVEYPEKTEKNRSNLKKIYIWIWSKRKSRGWQHFELYLKMQNGHPACFSGVLMWQK